MADEPGDFRMAGAYIEINLHDNTQADEDAIRARIQSNDAVTIATRLGKPDDKEFRASVTAITKEVGDKSKTDLKVELDKDSAAKFEAEVRALIDSASRGTVSPGIGSPSGGSASIGVAGSGFGGGLAALVAGGVALGAGAIGGVALSALPAVFTAIGVAAERSNPQVVQAFDNMTTAGKKALQDGFQPFVPTFVDLANEGRNAITGLTPEFQQVSTAAAPLLQIVGRDFIQATQEGIGGSIPILQSVRPVAQAVGDDIVKVERGIGGLFQNLDVGQAANGLSILGTDLQQILPSVGGLLSEIMPLGNALLSVLGPALRDTVSDLRVLTPVIDAAGAAISFLSPDIAAYAGPAAAALAVTKLLTGSWTDFGGAASKVASIVQDADGKFDKGASTLTSLANAVGITTKAQKDAAVQDAYAAAVKADLTEATAKQALAEAEAAFAAEGSEKNQIALAAAQAEAAATSTAAAEAEAALTEAETASTFALGPLGIALGAVAALALPFIGNMLSSSDATNKMTGELGKLQQAASDTQALANLFKTDPQAEQQLTMLQKYGVTLKDLADANNGDAAAQQRVAQAAKEAMDATNDKVAADQKDLEAAQNRVGVGGAVGTKTDEQTDALHRAKQALADDKTAQDAATQTYKDAQSQLDATTAAQKAQAAAAQQQAANNGLVATSVTMLGANYLQATGALNDFVAANAKASVGDMFVAITQDAVASGDALQTVTDHFTQTAQAARSASQSYQDSLHGEAQASLAVESARQGVATAERAVIDAITNVGIAENNVTKAQVAAQQAQINLNNARQTEIEQLKTLHLQLADQVTSEESARVALFDQTNKSAALGVTTANAAAIAAQTVTAQNEAQVQSAIDLMRAQQALDDTLNTGANLRTQVAQADAAGVEGAPTVVAAKQALASANDQVTSAMQALVKANQAVSDAQAGVVKAEQGVKDALYNEEKAAQATAQAFSAMTVAQAANSNTLDLNTAAGRANAVMQAQAAQQILNSHEPLTQQLADLSALGTKFNDNQQMVNLFTEKLLALSGVGVTFDVKGVATIDMTQLEQSLYPGSTPASISADLKDLARGGSAMFHAEGGPIDGIGGPKDDLNLAFLSRGEWVQPTDSVDYYGTPFMEAIRQKKIPKEAIQHFAGGGAVGANNADIATLMLSGYDGAIGSGYEIGGHLKAVFGFPFTDLPAPVPQSSPGAIAGRVPGVPASRSANEAAVQTVFSGYGWGSGPEWDAAVRLIMMESGFNNIAQNPTSSAYGIFQFLDSTWGGYGIAKTSDPSTQAIGGARYIRARYGDPLGALAHENAYHWYDEGGYVPPGFSGIHNATTRPEMMLPPRLGDTLEAIHAAVQGGTPPQPSVVHNHYHTWNISTQDPYVAAKLVAAEQSWNSRIGARG